MGEALVLLLPGGPIIHFRRTFTFTVVVKLGLLLSVLTNKKCQKLLHQMLSTLIFYR